LGLLVPSQLALPLLVLLTAGSFILAVATLLEKPWGLDGLVVYSVLGIVNAPAVLLSRSRLTYEAIRAQRLVVDFRLPVDTAMKIERVISTSVYGVVFTISAIYLYFLLTRRRAFRVACATRVEVAR
jgi:hypothetical protein